jgi:hypothetical protein
MIYADPELDIGAFYVPMDATFNSPTAKYNNAVRDFYLPYPPIRSLRVNDEPIDQFDAKLQKNWHMPDEYKNLDIAQYVLDLCKSEAELQRVGHELLLYQERNLFDLLRYLKYFVDTMRLNNIVWGLGRGSSVASYVLYLIGVHKIDSLYYDLPIEEFLKD